MEPDPRLPATSTTELIGQLMRQSSELAKREVELAKSELRADLKREIRVVESMGIAGVCALATLNLLLVAIVFAIAQALPGWAAALIVAAAVLTVGTAAGLIGWTRRVKSPLERTKKTVKEDVQWARRQIQ